MKWQWSLLPLLALATSASAQEPIQGTPTPPKPLLIAVNTDDAVSTTNPMSTSVDGTVVTTGDGSQGR